MSAEPSANGSALIGNDMLKAIIIDENLDRAEYIGLCWEICGGQVTSVNNAHEGLIKACSYIPNVIIIDHTLADGTGEGVLSFVRSNNLLKVTSVVIMIREQDVYEGLIQRGAYECILKPIDAAAIERIYIRLLYK